MIFDPFLSGCIPADLQDCSLQCIGTNLINIPTPPYINTTSAKTNDINPIIPTTIPNSPALTSTQPSLPLDDEIPVNSITNMETPLLTTILSSLVPDKAPIVQSTTIDELPISKSTMRIPTPPLLTTSTILTETSSSLKTITEMSTNKADMVPVQTKIMNIPTAPTIFKTTKLFQPVIEQLNNL